MCATNTEELILWNCTRDGSMASRSLPAGVGFKPPGAVAFKRRGGERLRKRRLIKMSGEYREDERKRTVDDAS